MKPNRLFVSGILLMVALPAAYAQQSTSNKIRAPELVTEDLKESSSSSPNVSAEPGSIPLDSQKWQRYSPQELALSIELPGKPILLGISFLDQPGINLSPAKAYAYQSKEISVFVFRFVSKKSRTTASDLGNFGAGFLDGSAKRPGVSDVKTAVRPKDDSTVLLESTFREGSVVFETRGFVHANGNDVWLVATRFAQTDESASKLAFRIINSVEID
jgi:hypothetical protein